MFPALDSMCECILSGQPFAAKRLYIQTTQLKPRNPNTKPKLQAQARCIIDVLLIVYLHMCKYPIPKRNNYSAYINIGMSGTLLCLTKLPCCPSFDDKVFDFPD
jgi:hypothetical protein